MPRILISGASGLLGAALVPSFEGQGYEVVRLVRRQPLSTKELEWNPTAPIAPALLSGFDVVIHLSGENIAGRWTEQKKCRIRESRIFTTEFLAQALAKAQPPPQLFLCASAIGYYGNRGDEILTEETRSGEGFFAEVCREWEYASMTAAEAGVRVVNLRTGIVLSRAGGALKQMLLPFKLGMGGRIGSGRQYWSWIHIKDWIAAIQHILHYQHLRGPVNLTAPNPVTNAEFTNALAKALKRPAFLPIAAAVARLAFGELAEEGLLSSARVVPKALIDSQFRFQHPEIEGAFRDLISQ